MITLVTEIPAFVLLSAIGDLIFTTDQTQATVTVRCGDAQILSETYIADHEQTITIYAFSDILEPSLLTSPMNLFSILIEDGSSNFNRSFYVLYCQADVPSTFVSEFFLSASLGEDKYTFRDAKECLFLVSGDTGSSDNIPVTADITYWDESSQTVQIATKTLADITANTSVASVDVSPSLFLNDTFELVGYTIYAGNRSQKYTLLKEYFNPTTFRFRNMFGCHEYVHFFGSKEKQYEITRSTAIINHKQQLYKVQTYPTWVVKSGYVSPANMRMMQDMLSSYKIKMLHQTGDIDVIITSHKTDITDDEGSYPELEVTVQQCNANRSHIDLPVTSVFDDTFDNSFN